MKDIEEQVERYLQQKELNYIKRSVVYVGEMKNEKVLDGKQKDVHLIRFQLSVGSNLENQICYIYADIKTKRLEYLITPHIFKKIDFE